LVTEATLCHVIRGDKILLKKATRGISAGKWNAPGGKIDPGETPEQCAKREVLEETGLRVSDLLYHGVLDFMMDGRRTVHLRGHLFSTRKATGRLRSSEEGPVKWVPLDGLPLDEMWEDDRYWMPLMLMGVKFDAAFAYDRANRHVVEFSLNSR
jgi:8-oxo-dGTP diphosphatase